MNRLPMIATVAAGLLIAGLPPAVAAASPQTGTTGAQCTDWAFNGTTDVHVIRSGNLLFDATGSSLGGGGLPGVWSPGAPVPPTGIVTGGIEGDQIGLMFSALTQGTPIYLSMQGQVNPDGTAHGTTNGAGPWQINSPLKCVRT